MNIPLAFFPHLSQLPVAVSPHLGQLARVLHLRFLDRGFHSVEPFFECLLLHSRLLQLCLCDSMLRLPT